MMNMMLIIMNDDHDEDNEDHDDDHDDNDDF